MTFDPFLYLSVPLPKKKRPVNVTFFRASYTVRPVTVRGHSRCVSVRSPALWRGQGVMRSLALSLIQNLVQSISGNRHIGMYFYIAILESMAFPWTIGNSSTGFDTGVPEKIRG